MARKKPALFGDLSQTTPPEPQPAPKVLAAPMEEEPMLPVPLPPQKARKGTKMIAGHFPTHAAKQFALLAVEQDKTHQALLIEALNDLLRKHGKHPTF